MKKLWDKSEKTIPPCEIKVFLGLPMSVRKKYALCLKEHEVECYFFQPSSCFSNFTNGLYTYNNSDGNSRKQVGNISEEPRKNSPAIRHILDNTI